jgi:transposase
MRHLYNKQQLAMIKQLLDYYNNGEMRVIEIAEKLSVTRTTVYNWIMRYNSGKTIGVIGRPNKGKNNTDVISMTARRIKRMGRILVKWNMVGD